LRSKIKFTHCVTPLKKKKEEERKKKKTAKKWQLKLTAADVGFNVKPKILLY